MLTLTSGFLSDFQASALVPCACTASILQSEPAPLCLFVCDDSHCDLGGMESGGFVFHFSGD